MTRDTPPEISIIIPTLNEAKAVPALIDSLTAQRGIRSQIIIADGGSTDGTREYTEGQNQLYLVNSPPGRGAQMNAGAAAASADWLLFIHADSLISDPSALRQALDQITPDNAGHFSLRFYDRPSKSKTYAALEEKTKLTRENTSNGDQGLLIHRQLFEQFGQFSTRWHFLEDQILNERLRKQGKLMRLSGTIHTSARRFESEGFKPRYYLMTLLMTAWTCGLTDFIDRAPEAYKNQADATAISLLPFLKLFKQLHRARPWKQRLQLVFNYGSYSRRNSWQLFLWLGFWLFKTRQNRLIWLDDKLIAPTLNLPVVKHLTNAVLGLVATSVIFYIAPLILQLRQVNQR